MLRKISLLGSVLLGLALALAQPATAQGASSDETELGPIFLLGLGGKLYDDLWTILDELPPEDRNPALSDALSVSRRDTWRCVTCHGWDYSGTTIEGKAFPSLTGLAGADPEMARAKLREPTHPFPADRLSDTAMDILALFVTQGQYARSDYISESGVAVGNPEFGRDVFEGACISCHQLDGRRYLKGEKGDRSSLGWVSRNRPEQAIHKILNGVPAAEMLSLRFLSDIQIADLLAYLQTLDPNEN
jgi:thiosulfate dehydrogenase